MEKYSVDIIIIAIILICALIGRKNGILSGIITLASAIISTILGKIGAPLLSPYVGKVLSPIIGKAVSAQPQKYIEKFVPTDKMTDFLQAALDKSMDAAQALVKELTLLTQDIVAFFIIFVIMLIIVGKILRFLSLHMPIVKTVNHILGFLFGTFVGIILVILIFSAVTKYISSDSTYISLLPYFENSYFARMVLSKI